MKPKCDMCEQDATVTEVTVKDGKRIERHLCENCAREAGITIQSTPIDKLMSTFLAAHAVIGQPATSAEGGETTGRKKSVANACKACGLAYAEFKQKGLLGCPECYRAFESQLAPLIERAHQGAVHHVGKTPRHTEPDETQRQRLTLLRKQLSDAIAAEQYERAALLRDELTRRVSNDTAPTSLKVARQAESPTVPEAAGRRPRARKRSADAAAPPDSPDAGGSKRRSSGSGESTGGKGPENDQ